ncbi:MAG: ABC transporter ATP-binding protein, partial [Planctomycetes bacterium]|nr:ABC transporter ATP-binding protein [Planctomycetota bacterium]
IGAGAALVGLTLLAGALEFVRGRLAALAAEGTVRRLRDRLFEHLERLPAKTLDRADSGDVIQRCTSDVETLRVFLGSQLVEIVQTVLLTATIVTLLFRLDARLAIATTILYPVIITTAVLFFGGVRRAFQAMDEAEASLTTHLQESLTGVRVVRAFARSEYERTRFAGHNAGFRDATYMLMHRLASYWPVLDLLCFTQVGITLFVGASLAWSGEISIGMLNSFLMLGSMAIWPVRQLGRVLTDSGKAVVAIERIDSILAEAEEEGPDERLNALEEFRGGVRFEGVRFRYEDASAPALDGIDLEIRPSETVAFLGAPGSGKSTLVALLLRLYEPQEGRILLDGVDLRTLARAPLRSRIGVVLQESFLYSKTLTENLSVGRSGATFDEIQRAADLAAIHESILEFERGYETPVGERGVTLSGGQRQRVSIARALLKDPALLVLDDSLSAVDTETESRILDALRRRKGRRTTWIITHRLSTAMAADRIVVLDHGRIAQEGSHEDLLLEDGPYRRLWTIQGALEDELRRDLTGVRGGGTSA